MSVLSIRVQASEGLFWAVVEGSRSEPTLIKSGKVPVPKGTDEAETLRHLRKRTLEIVQQYGVQALCIRQTEHAKSAGKSLIERCRIEGALLEGMASLGKPAVARTLATVGSSLDIKKPKSILSEVEFRGLNFDALNPHVREAVLFGIAALPETRE